MKQKVCPYCMQEFIGSRFHPEQVVCSVPACQRRRRAEYHKKKLAEDAEYRAQCEHSQAMWKENNPGYSKRYRARKKEGYGANGTGDPHPTSFDDILRLLRTSKIHSAKNTSALFVTSGFVEVWWASYSGARSAKNTLAGCRVVIVERDADSNH